MPLQYKLMSGSLEEALAKAHSQGYRLGTFAEIAELRYAHPQSYNADISRKSVIGAETAVYHDRTVYWVRGHLNPHLKDPEWSANAGEGVIGAPMLDEIMAARSDPEQVYVQKDNPGGSIRTTSYSMEESAIWRFMLGSSLEPYADWLRVMYIQSTGNAVGRARVYLMSDEKRPIAALTHLGPVTTGSAIAACSVGADEVDVCAVKDGG
jgi:hypothetical protein